METKQIEEIMSAAKALKSAQTTYAATVASIDPVTACDFVVGAASDLQSACGFVFDAGRELARIEYERDRAVALKSGAESQAAYFLARQLAVEKVLFARAADTEWVVA